MAVERRQNAAMKTFVKLISLTAVLLCSFVQVFAEGSVNYCTSGNRLFLDSGSHVYAYVKEGDVVHIGTSSYSKDKDLSITFPDGTKKDIDLDPGSNSEGLILNHTEEMRGPSPVSHGGYVPLSFRADSSGYMDIVFYGSDLMKKNTSCEENFTPCGENGGCRVAAWDITVTNASGVLAPGRVFSKEFKFSDANSVIKDLPLYALTADGYIYSINTGAVTGIDWKISSANRGVVHIPSNRMIYASAIKDSEYKREYMPDIEHFGVFPEIKQDEKPKETVDRSRASSDEGKTGKSDNTAKAVQPFVPSFKYTKAGDIKYRMFLDYPDSDLLEALNLSSPKPAPHAYDFSFEPYDDGRAGGEFTFESCLPNRNSKPLSLATALKVITPLNGTEQTGSETLSGKVHLQLLFQCAAAKFI